MTKIVFRIHRNRIRSLYNATVVESPRVVKLFRITVKSSVKVGKGTVMCLSCTTVHMSGDPTHLPRRVPVPTGRSSAVVEDGSGRPLPPCSVSRESIGRTTRHLRVVDRISQNVKILGGL